MTMTPPAIISSGTTRVGSISQVQFIALALLTFATTACVRLPASTEPKIGPDHSIASSSKPAVAGEPVLALWCDDEGTFSGKPPYLRFAIWEDGRMVFASDPQHRGKELREGQLSAPQIAQIKELIHRSRITSLTCRGHIVPDGKIYCAAAVVDGRKYTLLWDEFESNDRTSADDSNDFRAFVKCWKTLNSVGMEIRPTTSSPCTFPISTVWSWR